MSKAVSYTNAAKLFARQIFRNWGMQLDDYGLKFH